MKLGPQPPIVIIGMGEMGSVFARALLRAGHPVVPVTRALDMGAVAAELPDPQLALLATAETDLQDTLSKLPAAWRERAGLLQNELLPRDWAEHQLRAPTIISVWFEKKPGKEIKILMPSPAYGPQAKLLQTALAGLDIPVRLLRDQAALVHELVLKNVYILTTNIAGLEVGGTVQQLWDEHEDLARAVAMEVIEIQAALTGIELDERWLMEGMLRAIAGDPEHQCTGRSAPARLQRALAYADEAGLEVPHLRAMQAEHAG